MLRATLAAVLLALLLGPHVVLAQDPSIPVAEASSDLPPTPQEDATVAAAAPGAVELPAADAQDATAAVPAEELLVSSAATTAPVPPQPPTIITSTLRFSEDLASKGPSTAELARTTAAVKRQVTAAKAALTAALSNTDLAWTDYCRSNSLSCSDLARKATFIANLQRWAALNARLNDDYLGYGITQFAHLNASEFAATVLMEPLPVASPRAARLARLRQSQAGSGPGRRRLAQGPLSCAVNSSLPAWSSPLPPFWDWRNAGVITPVKAQKGCGSCSAFSTLATLESTWIRKWWALGYRANNTDLSEDDWLECTPGNQCKGAWPDSVFSRYICAGAPFESAAKYDAMDSNNCAKAPRYNVGAIGFAYVDANPTALAKAVRRNPTVIAVDAANWQGLAAGWVRNCGEAFNKLNHAVTVVGWVDKVPMSNGAVWDYWFVRNSWGPNFNNDGYIWIRKDCSTANGGPFGMFKTPAWTPVM